jgi:hypothetical protein
MKRKRENSLSLFINNDDIIVLIFDFLSNNVKDVLKFSMITKKIRKLFYLFSPYGAVINLKHNTNRIKYSSCKVYDNLERIIVFNSRISKITSFKENILKDWNYPIIEYKEEFKLLFLNMEFTKYEKNKDEENHDCICFHFKDDETKNKFELNNHFDCNTEGKLKSYFVLYNTTLSDCYIRCKRKMKISVSNNFLDLNSKLTKNIHYKYLVIFFGYIMNYFFENILNNNYFYFDYEKALYNEIIILVD